MRRFSVNKVNIPFFKKLGTGEGLTWHEYQSLVAFLTYFHEASARYVKKDNHIEIQLYWFSPKKDMKQ